MPLVCDSLNMCKEREEFINDCGQPKQTLNFCPFCGNKWFTSAISDNVSHFKEKDKLRDKIIKLRKEIKVLEKQWKNLCDEEGDDDLAQSQNS